MSLVEKKGELKDAKNALSKDFDVLCLGELSFLDSRIQS